MSEPTLPGTDAGFRDPSGRLAHSLREAERCLKTGPATDECGGFAELCRAAHFIGSRHNQGEGPRGRLARMLAAAAAVLAEAARKFGAAQETPAATKEDGSDA